MTKTQNTKNTRRAAGLPGSGTACLAWAGWRTQVPAVWRPLRIKGRWQAGSMAVGDGADVIMQIKWWRPSSRRFRADRWIEQRLRKMRASAQRLAKGPRSEGFDLAAYAPAGGDRGAAACSLWYGWASKAALVLEIAIAPEATEHRKTNRQVMSVIESLTAQDPCGPITWAMLSASFESPPHFRLQRHNLLLGDVSLLFTGSDSERLMLRQVYPAGLALSRSELPKWLHSLRLEKYRRYLSDGPPQQWAVESAGRTCEGLKCGAASRLPLPLSWVRPRRSVSAAMHDRRTDRLLLARHDAPGAADERLLRDALAGMNRAVSLRTEERTQ